MRHIFTPAELKALPIERTQMQELAAMLDMEIIRFSESVELPRSAAIVKESQRIYVWAPAVYPAQAYDLELRLHLNIINGEQYIMVWHGQDTYQVAFPAGALLSERLHWRLLLTFHFAHFLATEGKKALEGADGSAA